MVEILSVATAVPPHEVDAAEVKAYLDAYLGPEAAARFRAMVDSTRIRQRQTVVPVADLARLGGIVARNEMYCAHALALGERVARDALERTSLPQASLDAVLTVSCTGYMMPSLDAHLIARLGLPATARRLPITELGCAAGVGGVALGAAMLEGSSARAALVVSVELSSLGLQLAEPAPTDMVANLLFGDGAAALVLARGASGGGPEILASRSVLWPGTLDQLGMHLTETGLRLFLSPRVPALVRRCLRAAMTELLAAQGLGLDDLTFWAVHPGGPRVLEGVHEALGLSDAALHASWATWEAHGNLSSASVFFALRRLAEDAPPRPGDLGAMLAFGPGVTCEIVLLRAAGWLCGDG
jgi:alkylresorcinol/alkylpyrone synthase